MGERNTAMVLVLHLVERTQQSWAIKDERLPESYNERAR